MSRPAEAVFPQNTPSTQKVWKECHSVTTQPRVNQPPNGAERAVAETLSSVSRLW